MLDMTGATVARIASDDPELGARLILALLPALDPPIGGRLSVEGAGAFAAGDDFQAATDAAGLAALVAGRSPVEMMLRGRIRVRGRRRRVGALRALTAVASANIPAGAVEPDVAFRALPWLVDPATTRGYRFTVGYELQGDDAGGPWFVQVCDGRPLAIATTPPEDGPNAMVRIEGGDLLASVEGELHPAALLARWIARDDAELRRAEGQRLVQAARIGSGDELFARWERETWSASRVDLSTDREQWLALPTARQDALLRQIAPVAVATERMSAGFAALLPLAPSAEISVLLATQIADLAQATAFLDRFAGEVMALEPDDMRGRMGVLRAGLESGDGHDEARQLAWRVATEPAELDSFTDGVAAWHLVVGAWATVARCELMRGLERRSLFPGLAAGVAMIERDGGRHVEFAGAYVRGGAVLERRIAELLAQEVPGSHRDPAALELAGLGLELRPAEELVMAPA